MSNPSPEKSDAAAPAPGKPSLAGRLLRLLAALLVGTLLGTVGVGLLIWAVVPMIAQKPKPQPATPDPPPFEGDLDVLVRKKDNAREVRLTDPGVLPLKPGDRYRIELRGYRDAYLYFLRIDPDGTGKLVSPWKPEELRKFLRGPGPGDHLLQPEGISELYEIAPGKPGMETLVLLARDTPLPGEMDLRSELGPLPKQTAQSPRVAVWFENGKVDASRPARTARFDTKNAKDPLLITQQRIRQKLKQHFRYTRAVSFAVSGS